MFNKNPSVFPWLLCYSLSPMSNVTLHIYCIPPYILCASVSSLSNVSRHVFCVLHCCCVLRVFLVEEFKQINTDSDTVFFRVLYWAVRAMFFETSDVDFSKLSNLISTKLGRHAPMGVKKFW